MNRFPHRWRLLSAVAAHCSVSAVAIAQVVEIPAFDPNNTDDKALIPTSEPGYVVTIEAVGPDTLVEYPEGSDQEIEIFDEHDGILTYLAIQTLGLKPEQALKIQTAARRYRKAVADLAAKNIAPRPTPKDFDISDLPALTKNVEHHRGPSFTIQAFPADRLRLLGEFAGEVNKTVTKDHPKVADAIIKSFSACADIRYLGVTKLEVEFSLTRSIPTESAGHWDLNISRIDPKTGEWIGSFSRDLRRYQLPVTDDAFQYLFEVVDPALHGWAW